MTTVSLAASKREVSVTSLKDYTARSYLKLPTAVYRRVAEYCDTRARRRLSHVSQSWRALVSPLLWETIYVYDYPDCTTAAAHIHKQYKQHVRHLHLQSRHSRRDIPTWLDSPAEVSIIGAWLEVDWPCLESLSIRFLFTPVDIRIIDLARNMPEIKNLTVENSYLPWRDVAKWALAVPRINDLSLSYTDELGDSDKRRFAHLLGDYNVLQAAQGDGFRRLRLQYQPDELGVFYASILRTQPMLRELRIDRIPNAHVELLSRQLCFPSSLETLCLGMETSESLPPLTCLNPRSLPRLKRLMLRYNVAPLSQCQVALDEFTKHEWPRLQGLIVSVLTNDQCRRVVSICPNLQVLMVQPEAPAEHQIHNTGIEALLKGLRHLRRLYLVQQISPIGEMLTDNFIWKATHFEPPKMFSLRKSKRWESWAPKLASSPWVCASLQDLSLCGVYLSFPALIQLLSTLPQLQSLKVCIRSGTVGTVITSHMFEPWGRHSRLRHLTIDDIHEADLPRLRKLCEYMPCIRHCRILSQKTTVHPRSSPSSETSSLKK
ncbi:hypothetical protein GGI25_001126 [Coemansia spiralis]|uniref:F-box domain-containing protein n=2 Tax=Coemansia TaxID=4863 RepID=A0A9W8L0N1_9FUNG|nr:hypothetical protein BX070DRAFT_64337 [Coemansia spiralis]KAJ1995559.1 hypothetical protein EDC05_000797 [Coemansia umbellata]KAJ2625109.1 hypothetical protein GGI26_000912 [Coemansia sp. RSA 1358]KAJ2679937.1 hypothetical protein GGI25_001126 [Coemansia spiralis]